MMWVVKRLSALVHESLRRPVASVRNGNTEGIWKMLNAAESLKGQTAIIDKNSSSNLASFDISSEARILQELSIAEFLNWNNKSSILQHFDMWTDTKSGPTSVGTDSWMKYAGK